MRCYYRLFALGMVAVGLLVCQRGAVAEDIAGTAQAAVVPEATLSDVLSSTNESPLQLTSGTEFATDSCVPPADCDAYSDSCGCRRWIAEAEAVFLAPIQHQNYGFCQFIDGAATRRYDAPSTETLTVSPRIALGVQGECWGLLGRYWRLDAGGLRPDLDVTASENVFTENCFLAETFDLEVTRLFGNCNSCAETRWSFGVRYAQLHEAAGTMLDEYTLLNNYRAQVISSHYFSGTGLTMGLTRIRPVGCRGFNIFWDGRVSVLWDADTNTYVGTHANYNSLTGAAASTNNAVSLNDGNLFIGEIRAGGQWNLPLRCVPANAFFRLAFEYQYWCTGSDSGVWAWSAATPLGGPAILAGGAASGDSHVDLVGFTIGTGLTW